MFSKFGCVLEPDDLGHGRKPDIAFPEYLKTRWTITLTPAVEITAQLGNEDQGRSEGKPRGRYRFFSSSSSASHSHGSKTTAAGRSGTSRPNRVSSMMRHAITASMAITRRSASALWF